VSRTKRMQRISSLLQIQENEARVALAKAEIEYAAADAAVTSVFEQCRNTAAQAEDGADADAGILPLKAARLIVQSGWMEATHRATIRHDAAENAERSRADWQHAHRRHEATTRLVARWEERGRVEADRKTDAQLDDLINARQVTNERSRPDNFEDHPEDRRVGSR